LTLKKEAEEFSEMLTSIYCRFAFQNSVIFIGDPGERLISHIQF